MIEQSPPRQAHVGPPSRHALALMIWIAVVPTLIGLQLLLGPVLAGLPMVLRTLVMVTIAVPIVVYGVMPALQHLRVMLLTARAQRPDGTRE
jgi:antibiotic biosynthesis monooxygenase (ABM) superfamily enzyme